MFTATCMFATLLLIGTKADVLKQILPWPKNLYHSGFQVHLSLGEAPQTYVVTWLTPSPVARPMLVLTAPVKASVLAASDTFVDGGSLHRTQYVHRATTPVLAPGVSASYTVTTDDNGTATKPFFFITVDAMATSASFTLYGDFGLTNPVAMPQLVKEAAARRSDVLIHIGDFAYDMDTNNAMVGDAWANEVEPVYAIQPVMTCPGNHESEYDFLNYKKRFSMPMRTTTDNMYFSFDFGPVHWLAFDTERYFEEETSERVAQMVSFIEQDLLVAVSRRAQVPWIAAYGHRPMYCSNNDDSDCTTMNDKWKSAVEALFMKYRVDFVFEAHQHTYERLWPTYNYTVMNGTAAPYTNPPAPIHIVTGAAGCPEGIQSFGPPLGPWSAVRVAEYGIGHLDIKNATHAYFEQINVPNKTGGLGPLVLADAIWVIKDPQQ